MEFGSMSFLWVFLPLAIVVFYATRFLFHNIKLQNAVLFVLSSVFYIYRGGVSDYIRIICTIGCAFWFALWIDCFRGSESVFKESRKGVFIASIVTIVFILCYYKYLEMAKSLWYILKSFTSIYNLLTGLLKYGNEGTFPLAISFITFQCISYLTDVYKGDVAEKNFLTFGTYNLLFFKLVQGPIMKFSSIKDQEKTDSCSLENFSYGVSRFCFGLAKKVLIANTLAQIVNEVWLIDAKEAGTLVLWTGLVFYTLQIYYDFSGYSDMAVGLGRMFGFSVIENFNYPYTSLSVQEFWRRWHISLSLWFKEYIYIPLGGNRKGLSRTLLNLSIVFFITGLWHGASLNYIAWGLYFALFSIIERLFFGSVLKKNPIKLLNWIYTMFVIMIGWVLFRSVNLYEALRYLKYLFVFKKPSDDVSVLSSFNMSVVIMSVCGFLLIGWIQRGLSGFLHKHNQSCIIGLANIMLQVALFALSILMLVNGSYNPSIYANF